MPSYNFNPDGTLDSSAPPEAQASWNEFQGSKAPASSAGMYRQQANDEARQSGEPLPFPGEGGDEGDGKQGWFRRKRPAAGGGAQSSGMQGGGGSWGGGRGFGAS